MKWKSLKIKTIFLVRHGETELNKNKQILGQQDVDLNKVGIFQSIQAVAYLISRKQRFEIITSPLYRAKYQAKLMSRYYNIDFKIADELLERDWGKLTGDLKSKHPGVLKNTPPNGESFSEFTQRVISFINALVLNKDSYALITHLGVIREVMRYFGHEMDSVSNGQIIKLEFDNTKMFSSYEMIENKISNYDLSFKHLQEINVGNADIYEFISKSHSSQKRANGNPYITHLLRVAESVKESGSLEYKAGMMHDLIEDTDISYNDILQSFGKELADLVRVLTLLPNKKYDLQKEEYLKNIIDYGNSAIKIKLADFLDNLNDIEEVSINRLIKMANKALYFMTMIKNSDECHLDEISQKIFKSLTFKTLSILEEKNEKAKY